MCVIAFSPKGIQAPTEEQIRAMFRANSDGAGFAYNGRNGEVFYEKGFMTVDALLERLKPLDQWTNTNLGIHFRIGTAGKNDEKTCHPFPISTDLGTLRKTSGTGDVLFHNGILAEGGWADSLSSDTQDFVIAFAPLLAKPSKSTVRDKWIEELIKGNRILTMYKNNRYKMYGDWQKDGDIFVSNLTYKNYSYGYYMPSSYAKWYGYDYDDDLDDEYGMSNGKQMMWAEDPKTHMYRYFTKEEYLEMLQEQEFERIIDEFDKPTKKEMSVDEELAMADQLYEELEEMGMLERVTPKEKELLFKYADSVSGNTFTANGYYYYYDEKYGFVGMA